MRTSPHQHSRRGATGLAVAALGVALVGASAAAAAPDHDRTDSSQDRINAVLDPIILANVPSYSDSGFHDDGTAYVAFTAPLPAAERATILRHGDITLIEDATLDADTADVASAEIFSAARAAAADGTAVTVHVDPLDGAAVVATSVPLLRELTAPTPGVAVTVTVDPSLAAATDASAGIGGAEREVDPLYALGAASGVR